MVVEYRVAEMGYVRYYLAPKASGEEGADIGPPQPDVL